MNKIVIASILKPVTDTRMFEKMAKSIVSENDYEVHIIAHQINEKLALVKNVYFYPIFNFSRLSIFRLFTAFKFLKMLINIKPQTIIICTHELLIPSVIYKFFFKVKLIYDVQENYYYNIIYSKSFHVILKYPIAIWVRSKEVLLKYFINHFILAEKCYSTECKSFVVDSKSSIIENKYIGECRTKSSIKINKGFKMIYSGTIAEIYGVLDAIELAIKLNEIDEEITLTIIGYASDIHFFNRILKITENKPFIQIIGGSTLIPHEEIIEALKTADVAILSYQYNESTINKIPTKIYECLALSLPMILPSYSKGWNLLTKKYNASIAIDYTKINGQLVYDMLLNSVFYSQGISTSDITWPHDEFLSTILN